MGLIYLDACALIDAREKSTPESQALVNLIAEGPGSATPFITSDLSLVEVLTKPIQGLIDRTPEREDSTKRADHDWYLGNLIPDGLLFQTKPLHRDILLQAAIMRARTPSLKTPDAIHAATAYHFGCTHFVTGDTKLMRSIERDQAWQKSPRRFSFVQLTVEALDTLRTELIS
jgi:predicted nucleic acid-binding protein